MNWNAAGNSNPKGVAARRPKNSSPVIPTGHNPVGVEAPRRRHPGLSLRSNPGLGYTTALRLKPRTPEAMNR